MTKLATFQLQDLNTEGLTDLLKNRTLQNKKTLLFFANTNFIVSCQHLSHKMRVANAIILNDGIGMDIASWIVNGHPFSKNLNGTDFMPNLLKSISTQRIVLLGSTQKDLIPTAKIINQQFNHEVVALFDGYQDVKDENLIEKINALNPSIILVGMGNPLQEEWILNNYKNINANLYVGVGALFVFMSGNRKRAPKIIRTLRLEWFYRLMNEPLRLYKRYTVDLYHFFKLCLKHKAN